MSDVTFTIVENYSHEHKFDDFAVDYDNGMSKTELLKKYDISNGVWVEWRDRLDKRGWMKAHFKEEWDTEFDRTLLLESKLIKGYGSNYAVYRKLPNGRKKSYGTYSSKELAQKVRIELVANNWDYELAYSIIEKWATPKSKSRLLRRLRCDNADS